jgi:hypothetical protein
MVVVNIVFCRGIKFIKNKYHMWQTIPNKKHTFKKCTNMKPCSKDWSSPSTENYNKLWYKYILLYLPLLFPFYPFTLRVFCCIDTFCMYINMSLLKVYEIAFSFQRYQLDGMSYNVGFMVKNVAEGQALLE